MIVYHGSNSKFEKLRIERRLIKSRNTSLNEGMGIYFSTHPEVAASYGLYLYTIDLEDKSLLDFREMNVCREYVLNICKYVNNTAGIQIQKYFSIRNLASSMYEGIVGISEVGREIALLLDSDERWYMDNSQTNINSVIRTLNSYGKKRLKAYLFNYNIPDIGIIKDTEVAKIVSRDKLA